jgi:PAS domain S-box-containing protein
MGDREKKTILLVEDEAIIAAAEALTIGRFGYEVIIAHSGPKAVRVAADEMGVALVLMDVDLGRDAINGPETARRILAERNVPIVFLTSHSEREMVEKVRGITRYGYVIKNSGDFVLQSSIEMAFELFNAHENMRESEEKYRAAFMTSPDSVNINDMDGLYVDVNEGFLRLTGFTREEVIGRLSSEINIWAIPEDRAKLVKGLAETGTVKDLETIFRLKDGSLKNGSMSARVITLNNKPHILSITRDITELSHGEMERRVLQEIMNGLVTSEDLHDFLGVVHRSISKLISADNFFVALFNKDTALFEEAYSVDKFDQPAPPSRLEKSISRYVFRTGQPLLLTQARFDELLARGEVELVGTNSPSWLGVPLKSPREAIGVMVVQDYEKENRYSERDLDFLVSIAGPVALVVERKQAELALQESEGKYRGFFENVQDVYYEARIDGTILDVSPSITTISLGQYQRQDLIGMSMNDLYVDVGRRKILLENLREKGSVVDFEVMLRNRDGSSIPCSISAKIHLNGQGRPDKIVGSMRAITERKRAEEKIKNLLREKELLLKEVHHRVKNNMTSAMGFLSLQAGATKNPEVEAVLLEARNRMQSMLVLYDKLYRSENLSVMSVRDYLSPLVDEILAVFPNRAMVRIVKEIGDFDLGVKELSSLGIIVNELLCNAMKHAFPGTEGGALTVSAANENDHVVVVIEDNGRGIPPAVTFGDSSGFGLQVVSMVAGQIGATIRIERGQGTRFVLEFERGALDGRASLPS